MTENEKLQKSTKSKFGSLKKIKKVDMTLGILTNTTKEFNWFLRQFRRKRAISLRNGRTIFSCKTKKDTYLTPHT